VIAHSTQPSITRCLPCLKSEPSPIAAINAVAVLGPIPRILAILTIIRHSLCAIAYCYRPSKEDKESSSGDVGPVLSSSFNRP
jgi:hypothetical protein